MEKNFRIPQFLGYHLGLVNSALIRGLVVYGAIVPLAVLVGWMMSSPLNMESLTVVGGVLFVLVLPLILQHHYAMLVFSWNAMLVGFFLPGKPYFWAVMVVINLIMALAYRILQRRPMFISAPSIAVTLVLLLGVVLATAQLRGGFGLRVLGSSTYGSKAYFYVIMAVLGYFAFASRSFSADKAHRFFGYFYLSGTSAIVSNLIYWTPSLWFLYMVFPAGLALTQAQADFSGANATVRLGGFSVAAGFITYYLLARWGAKGLFSVKHFWRLLIFTAVCAVALLGGYRSVLVFIGLLFVVLYLIEGLLFTRWTVALALAAGLGFLALIPIANKLPFAAQRALSFLPLDVDPGARLDAQGSWEWRVQMWQVLAPELPNYKWLGKGYSLNPTEMFLVEQSVKRGLAPAYATSLYNGDYHNGPLSVYVPFGIPGVLAFIAFIVAAFRALYLNYRYGNENVMRFNRFLFAFFVAKLIFFLTMFGAFASDLAVFVGLVGLSVAMNHGICRRPKLETVRASQPEPIGLVTGTA